MKKKTGKKIIFICTGNTCRSPMAEKILASIIKKEKWKGYVLSSAGIAAKDGDCINPKSAQVLTENGLECEGFSSTLLKEEDLLDAFAVICMTERQKDVLLDMRWQALKKANKIGDEEISNNIYSFMEVGGYDVLDPYGRDLECYRYVFGLLTAGMKNLVERLRLAEFADKPKPRAPRAPKTGLDATMPPSNAENVSKKRGRPRKNPETSTVVPTEPKKRGRPKKKTEENSSLENVQLQIDF